ncbi:hypothetical protein QE416_000783 [Microbacterium sp. SORGH_AS 421]|nr:hypothetical protein [Microbacterium sp. SORGH_AS_0421]
MVPPTSGRTGRPTLAAPSQRFNLVRDGGQGEPYERTLIEGPVQRAASFAAAFAARLCSRTLVSDSGLTMSATDRNDPSSP